MAREADPGLRHGLNRTMLKVALIVIFGVAATATAMARSELRRSDAPRKTPDKPLLSRAPNPCAAFGPGFVKLDGSDTCVRVGGSISVGAGGGTGSRGWVR